jgi:type IV pilus assembly protein PilY1
MRIHKKLSVKLLWLLPLAALAATPFIPDWVNNSTYAPQPVGFVGAPVASGYILSAGTKSLFTIDYSALDWSGDLHSYNMSSNGEISTVDNWGGGNGADSMVDAQNFDTGRKIVTMHTDGSKIAFRWGNLSLTQKLALDSASSNLSVSPVLNYIRGERSNELITGAGGSYRSRNSVLGDIIHSTPVYWNDGADETVFVGANDGMLHAFNANSGAERFAYIPSMLIPKLPALKVTPYKHHYYVDGQLAARNFGSQSVLVGGLGGGGMGLFALDITTVPADEIDAASKILWEISNTSTGFENLGHTYGKPVFATLPDGTEALIVANGYNNGDAVNNPSSTGNGHASLFIIDPITGEKIAEIDAGTGSAASPNGLSSPTLLDINFDGKMDYAYAGDLDGNLWKFDLSARTSSKLFTTNPAQAITMAPSLRIHPNGGYMVTFVTGKIFTADDKADATVHYAYGIWDRPAAYAANNDLLTQTLTEEEYTGSTSPIRVRRASNHVPNWSAFVNGEASGTKHHMGWKTALVGGERVVGDGAIITGAVFLFLSSNPTINASSTPPGENWWMQLNALTGGDNASVMFDLNEDLQFTALDQIEVNTAAISPVGRFMGGGVRSQLTGFATTGVDLYIASFDRNVLAPSVQVSVTSERGVSGGHFDFDIFCDTNCKDTSGASPGIIYTGTDDQGLDYTHVHEYDDIYDVTGVDMLNPSQSLHKLSRVKSQSIAQRTIIKTETGLTYKGRDSPPGTSKINVAGTPQVISTTSTKPAAVNGSPSVTSYTTTQKLEINTYTSKSGTGKNTIWTYNKVTVTDVWTTTSAPTTFKILVANQAYSPAAKLSIGGEDYVSVYRYQTAAGLTVASLPTYTLANIGTLKFNLPLNAFRSQDWGTGIVRAGLHPSDYSCVVNNGNDGPSGERRDGALTLQIVDATVTDNDIELNVAGRPELGYVLKAASMAKLVAEYTAFWHHPNKLCMADFGWRKNPDEDTSISDAKAAEPAAGSTDPRDGLFVAGGGPLPGTTTTTVTNVDGTVSTITVTTVLNADGSITTTTTTVTGNTTTTNVSSDSIIVGGVEQGGALGGAVSKAQEALGGISWRELFR